MRVHPACSLAAAREGGSETGHTWTVRASDPIVSQLMAALRRGHARRRRWRRRDTRRTCSSELQHQFELSQNLRVCAAKISG